VLCKSRYIGWQGSYLGLQVYHILADKLVALASKFLLSLTVKCSLSYLYNRRATGSCNSTATIFTKIFASSRSSASNRLVVVMMKFQ
jgi:hypothetical protein